MPSNGTFSFCADSSSQTSIVPLMQIDCEVLDTRLIHVKYGAIPDHLRNNANTTDNIKEDSAKSVPKDIDNNDSYKPYFIHNNNTYYKPTAFDKSVPETDENESGHFS